MLTLEGCAGPVAALAFSPDGETLAGGGPDDLIHLWRPPADAGTLAGQPGGTQALAFSPDGRFLAVGGAGGEVRVWDVPARTLLARAAPEPFPVTALAFVGPGTVLFGIGKRTEAVARSSTVFLLDLATRRERRFPFDVVNGIRAAAGLPGRRVAAWATDRKVLRVQDITRPPGRSVQLKNDPMALALSPDGRRLAVTSDWEVLLFDLNHWGDDRGTVLGRHQGKVSTLAFGPDGRTLYSGDWKNTVRVWDVDRQAERASFTWPVGNRVTALAVSPDGLRAAAGGDAGTVAVWDLD